MLDSLFDFQQNSFEKNYKFVVENIEDTLYLTIIYIDEQLLALEIKVFIYEPLNQKWKTLYQQNLNHKNIDFYSTIKDQCQIKILKIINKTLLIIFEYAEQFLILRLNKDYNLIEEIELNDDFAKKLISSCSIGGINNLFYLTNVEQTLLEIIKINELLEISSFVINLPQNLLKNNFKISQVYLAKDNFYLGIDHEQKGFTISKKEYEANENNEQNYWHSIIEKGAYRYSLNQKISFITFFQDCIYVASGLNLDEQNLEKNKYYPSGFEIIRIYNDDDWDIITGNPQFTPQGLKVPLSGYGSGFDHCYNCLVESLIVHQDQLCLLTKNIDNLQLWQSSNGEDWQLQTIEYNLENYTQFKVIKTLSCSWGLIYVVNLRQLNLQQNYQILVIIENKKLSKI